jgi:hypothetical protein
MAVSGQLNALIALPAVGTQDTLRTGGSVSPRAGMVNFGERISLSYEFRSIRLVASGYAE